MNTKFNATTLRSDRHTLDNLEKNIITILHGGGLQQLTHQQLHKLLVDFRGVINVAAMYNDVIEQQLTDGYVTTQDPQDYITSRLP